MANLADPPADPAARATLPIALGAFAVYVATLAPAPYLLDSAELAAASFGLGVAHPPGEPVGLLLGRLFALLPLGSVAFRVGLSQAVAGAAAVALVYRFALDLLHLLVPEEPWTARALLGAAAALGFGLAPGAIMSANRPEVYALATALGLGALLLAWRGAQDEDARPALLAAVLIGLGLGNHPLIAGLCGIAAALAALPLLRTLPRGRLVAGSFAALGAGMLVLVYLPMRAAVLAQPGHGSEIAWGDGRTLGGLWWILSARTFLDKASVVHGSADPAAFPFVMIEELGALALLALAGLFFALRARATRWAAVVLAVALAAASAAALQAGFDPQNPDIRGYLGLALATTAVLAVLGVAPLLAAARRPVVEVAGAALLLVVVLVHALPVPPAVNLHRARGGARLAHQFLTELPPHAVVATAHFETAFLLAYQRVVDGQRPDVTAVHLGFVRGPGYADRLVRDDPWLQPLLAAHQAFALAPPTLSGGRSFFFEPDEHLTTELRAQLSPEGAWWRFPPAGERPAPVAAAVLGEAAGDRQLRGFVAYRAFRDAELACARGLRLTARLRLGEVAALIPDDARLAALARRCEQ